MGPTGTERKLKQSPQFLEWYRSLRDPLAQTRIAVRVFRAANGNRGDCKSVGSGIFELRLFFGPGYRVYFQERGGALLLLLCGGDKSTQSADIRKAAAISQTIKDEEIIDAL